MTYLRSSLALTAAAALFACAPSSQSTPAEPAGGADAALLPDGSTQAIPGQPEPPRGPPPWSMAGGKKLVTVMTRNLYLGADINKVMNPPAIPGVPGEVALAVTADALWETVQANDFPSRARALAAEIAAIRPDLVALQEASLYRLGPGLACQGHLVPPEEVALDYLAILTAELAARGTPYRVAAQVENFDGTLCALKLDPATGQPVRALDVRLTDRDVVLVRGDLPVRDARAANYVARATFSVPGVTGLDITIPRGWASAEVKVRGEWLRFVGTHLEEEVGPLGIVQMAQAEELAALLAHEPLPVILAGDFNAFPGGPTTSHALLRAAGFHDAWELLRSEDPGPTCCFAEDLRSGALETRIDLVWLRGGLLPWSIARTGATALTPAGLHPSDHAGVAARALLLDPRFER
ncbi:MAG TPA: endonuclease/exonuclease/phosphatase family protein [Anaeromyxobacteraceae bacterium]|nr:endonuclease/exonuclease/phosphatase family protein [Anaeromyxobacteraceae bacterium]